jgi:uncharacterized protein YjeT (DUF2065 family)
MSELGMWTFGLAAIMLILHGCCLVSPARARTVAQAFPRDKWAGRILATLGLLWAAWLVREMPMGRFEHLKQWLYVVTPVTIGLSFVFMNELLAPRALGGLLLLCPAPILLLARLHESPWSRVMTVVAYVMVVKGVALMLSPYLFRRAALHIVASDGRCRIAGCCGVAFDIALLALAVFVY